jgi:hypothetical protein
MNRLAPLIVRRYQPAPVRRAAPLPTLAAEIADADDPLADLKLFATGWLGGLVFFGTLFA